MAGRARSSTETNALHIAELGPEDRGPRSMAKPRLGDTQNGPLALNLSMAPRAGAKREIQKKKKRKPSNDARPYMGLYERANA